MYLGLCAAGEHFFEYRVLAKERIQQQLERLNAETAIAPTSVNKIFTVAAQNFPETTSTPTY